MYRKKIKLYFIQDWYLLSFAIIAMLYWLVNYLSNSSFIIFRIDRGVSLFFGIVGVIIFSIKFFFISIKLKSRLIYEVVDETKFYTLAIYNKTLVKLDKTLIPLYKGEADYLSPWFVSSRTGMWNIKSFNFFQAVSTPSQSKLAQVSRPVIARD
jgi:hypothetical protein